MGMSVPEFLDTEELGERIIEMAERVVVAHKVVPGAEATCSFELNDQVFQVIVRVKSSSSN